MMGSFMARVNQNIQFVKVQYSNLPTIGKELSTFPQKALGLNLQPRRWEASVLFKKCWIIIHRCNILWERRCRFNDFLPLLLLLCKTSFKRSIVHLYLGSRRKALKRKPLKFSLWRKPLSQFSCLWKKALTRFWSLQRKDLNSLKALIFTREEVHQ